MREGGCLCGAIRYRVEGEPVISGICHCVTCRKAASAPVLPFATFGAGRFTFTGGMPVLYRSSLRVTRDFCGQCGSLLTYRTDDDPGVIDVMLCSLDDPHAFPPDRHVWVSHRVQWHPIADGLPAYLTTQAAGDRL